MTPWTCAKCKKLNEHDPDRCFWCGAKRETEDIMDNTKPIVSLAGHVVRVDVADRYAYRRGGARRKLAPVARVMIQPQPTAKQEDDGETPEPYEFDVPREFCETLTVGKEVSIQIQVK